nr:Aspartate ammonia-lyase [Candidatus Pantoea persica]
MRDITYRREGLDNWGAQTDPLSRFCPRAAYDRAHQTSGSYTVGSGFPRATNTSPVMDSASASGNNKKVTMENNIRIEEDLLGMREVPADAYYGVHTLRAIENFRISNSKISDIPEFVRGMVMVKKAAALANKELQTIPRNIANAIIQACDEVLNNGKCMDQFPVDVYQGSAGTSVKMNTDEVLVNIGMELMGHQKGDYQFLNPDDHVNKCQSTNDAYPTGFRIAVYSSILTLLDAINAQGEGFERKAVEFETILKMGRTQLQDAVPMMLGQEFHAFHVLLNEETRSILRTAEVSKLPVVPAEDLIEATSDCGAYVMVHSSLKRLVVKLSKICNDLRLLSSGPRAGLNEINLPELQAGSSIMPAKVNPVVPEVVNQVCFKVIGNDTTLTMAAEAGQLQLNVMEPVIG